MHIDDKMTLFEMYEEFYKIAEANDIHDPRLMDLSNKIENFKKEKGQDL